MAGQMGNERVTTQNLQVVAVDLEDNLILVKGAVPGARSGWVLINDAVKKPMPEDLPLPAGLKVRKKDIEAEQEKLDEAQAEVEAQAEAERRAAQEEVLKAAEAKAEENAEEAKADDNAAEEKKDD